MSLHKWIHIIFMYIYIVSLHKWIPMYKIGFYLMFMYIRTPSRVFRRNHEYVLFGIETQSYYKKIYFETIENHSFPIVPFVIAKTKHIAPVS